MLTIRQCRRLLGAECPLTDDELVEMLKTMYAIAKVAIDLESPSFLDDVKHPEEEPK